jgi:transposase InsO family protein
LTAFGKLLVEHDVTHRTSAPYYPQGNGKAEAFIKTLNRELLKKHSFDTLEELQAALDKYLVYYNNYRLHSQELGLDIYNFIFICVQATSRWRTLDDDRLAW